MKIYEIVNQYERIQDEARQAGVNDLSAEATATLVLASIVKEALQDIGRELEELRIR